ncbi:hypothetical protein HWV62_10511 [Athelia sp. TMB]|nr:hypothetical protein HWV62_10511 [Athelia sp. TMB]
MLTRNPSRQPSVPLKTNKPSKPFREEVIVISDDDDDRHGPPKAQPHKRKARGAPIARGDILEISDDDDQIRKKRAPSKTYENLDGAGAGASDSALLEQIKALQWQFSRKDFQLQQAQMEIGRLRAEVVQLTTRASQSMDPAALDDEKHLAVHPNYSSPPLNLAQLPLRTRTLLIQARSNPDSAEARKLIELDFAHANVQEGGENATRGGVPSQGGGGHRGEGTGRESSDPAQGHGV